MEDPVVAVFQLIIHLILGTAIPSSTKVVYWTYYLAISNKSVVTINEEKKYECLLGVIIAHITHTHTYW